MGRRFDSYIDERYPPGSAARAEFDAAYARLTRRDMVIRRLAGWMLHVPPRWVYATDGTYDPPLRFYHGVGHIAWCFWYDILDGLIDGRDMDEGPGRWLARVFYNALDGLAFHYFDDAYVPWPREVGTGIARRWRRRQAAARRVEGARIREIRRNSGDEDLNERLNDSRTE